LGLPLGEWRMKVSELEGKDLDYWVAKAQGWGKVVMPNKYESYWEGGINPRVWYYTPSTNGGQCFELLTIADLSPMREMWFSSVSNKIVWTSGYEVEYLQGSLKAITSGPTLNIAICRAFVASVYGDEVSDEG
jgi:hypothetical protein